MKMMAENIFSANTTRMGTLLGVHGLTSTSLQSRQMMIPITNQFILPRTCLKWREKPTIYSLNSASFITIQTSIHRSTFSTPTLQMALAAAG